MAQGCVHVVSKDGRWIVRMEGLSRARSRNATQPKRSPRAAPSHGRPRGLPVHGRTGAIRERRSYGGAPRRRKG